MSRRRYLVTYDVSDDKRRTKLFRLLEGEGDHVQYSVFLCELNHREFIRLKSEIDETINHHEDQVLFLDLGHSELLPAAFLSTLGRAYLPPCPTLVV